MSNKRSVDTQVFAGDLALLLGRIAMAALFLPSGLNKLMNYSRVAGSIATKTLPFGLHLPFPAIWGALAIAIEVGGPLLLLVGYRTRWVSWLMIAFVIMATLTTHRYWDFEGQARQLNESNFYKNIGLIGGFLFLYVSGAGRLSLDGWRRGRKSSAG